MGNRSYRNDWRREYDVENEIIVREKEIQKQWEMNRIEEARYNQMYRSIIKEIEEPKYLLKSNLDQVSGGWSVRMLVKLRCGNLEEENKYRLK